MPPVEIEYNPDTHTIEERGAAPRNPEKAIRRFRYFLLRRAAILHSTVTSKKFDSLTIEPRSSCCLSCTYCYNQSKSTRELDLDRVWNLLDQHKTIERVFVYGGDIFDKKDYAQKLFDGLVKRKKSFACSSGGYHLDSEMVSMLNSLSNRIPVTVQISLEPSGWGLRKSPAGEHIMDRLTALNSVHNLGKKVRVSTLTVIPTTQSVPYIPLRKFISDLKEIFGRNVRTGFSMECGGLSLLPDWIEQWEKESMELLRADPTNIRHTLYAEWWRQFVSTPYRYSGCGGVFNPSIGPNKKVYSCHHQAIDGMETSDWLLDNSKEKSFEWAKYMDNPHCQGCPSRYSCGATCYLYPPSSSKNAYCISKIRSMRWVLEFLAIVFPTKFWPFKNALDSEKKIADEALQNRDIDGDYKVWNEIREYPEAMSFLSPYLKDCGSDSLLGAQKTLYKRFTESGVPVPARESYHDIAGGKTSVGNDPLA